MFDLDVTIHPKLAPLAWLLGEWEGAGVVGYPTMEPINFGQSISVTHDGRPFLAWESTTWRLDDDGTPTTPSARETGYWRVLDSGDIELLLAHPTGILELYVGEKDADRPIVNLATDGVMRSAAAKEYNAGRRMYGYVEGQLMYAVDMAAVGQSMQAHFSAQLKRVS